MPSTARERLQAKLAAQPQQSLDQQLESIRQAYSETKDGTTFIKKVIALANDPRLDGQNGEIRNKIEALIETTKGEALSRSLGNGNDNKCAEILKIIGDHYSEPEKAKFILPLITHKFAQLAYNYYSQSAVQKNIKHFNPLKAKQKLEKALPEQKGEKNTQSTPSISNPFLEQIFINALCTNDANYLFQVINTFRLDLKTLAIPGSESSSIKKHTPITAMCIHYNNVSAPEQIQIMLKLLNQAEVSPDSDKERADFNYTLQGFTSLMIACIVGKENIIKILVEAGADINLLTSYHSLSGSVTVRTPFSCAVSSGSLDIVNMVLELGADPTLTIKKKSEEGIIEIQAHGLGAKMAADEINEYLTKVNILVEEFLLNKLIEKMEENSVTNLLVEQPEANKEFKQAETTTKESVEQIIDTYIAFKEQTIKATPIANQSATIEHSFDLLLLNYIKTGSPEHLTNLQLLVEKHPELNHYAIKNILDLKANQQLGADYKEAGDLAAEVFCHNPKILHQFFTLRKQIINSSAEVSPTPEIEGIYQVNSNIKNKIFIKLSEELQQQLEAEQLDFYQKVKNKMQDCNFIKKDSHNVSGIKTYDSIIKLKIAGEDLSLVTNSQYVDKHGDVLIIFEQIKTHSENARSSGKTKLATIKVEDFTQIFVPSVVEDTAEVVELHVAQLLLDSPELLGQDSSDHMDG